MKHKKTFVIAIAALLVMSGLIMLIAPSGDDENLEGAVPEGYIPVTNAADLARVGTGVTNGGYTWSLTANYYQTANITLTGTNNHTPIGTLAAPFTGIYDGGENKITGLNLTTTTQYSGLFGYVVNGLIKNVFLSGDLSSTSTDVGGILGTAKNTVIGDVLINCSFSGTVSGSVRAGGIAGLVEKGIIRGCFNDGTINSTMNAAGIVCQMNADSRTIGCSNSGQVKGSTTAGGISYAAGIVAQTLDNAASVEECNNQGNISVTTSGLTSPYSPQIAGGIVASGVQGLVVKNCFNTGNVSASVTTTVSYLTFQVGSGGIVGATLGTSNMATVTNCYQTGNVSGVTVGGNGTAYAGQFIGRYGADTNNVTSSYYLSTISVVGTVQYQRGTSLTDAQMKVQSNFSGWDFSSVWVMGTGSYLYPVLKATLRTIEISGAPVTMVLATKSWSYRPTFTPSDATVSISGVPWLSLSSGTISGTAPTPSGSAESQNFNLVITVSKSGYETATQNVTIKVYRELNFTTTPTAAMVVTSLGNNTFLFDASGSTDYESITWDFANGATSDGLIVQYTFPKSGVYNVQMTAVNSQGSDTASYAVTITDDAPQTEAWVGKTYVYAPEGISGTPTLSGASWLSWDSEHGRVSGTPSVSDIGTYTVILQPATGAPITWTVHVYPSSTVPPISSFTFTAEGLKVTFLSSSSNATITYWSFGDGKHSLNVDPEHTYSAAGTYTVTLEVRNSEGVDVYNRVVTVSAHGVDDDGGSGGSDDNKDLKDSVIDFLEDYAALIVIAAGAILALLGGGKWENIYVFLAGLAILVIGIIAVWLGYLDLPWW